MSSFVIYSQEDYLLDPQPVEDYLGHWCSLYLPEDVRPDVPAVTARLSRPLSNETIRTFIGLSLSRQHKCLGGVILEYHVPSGVLWVSCLVRRKSTVFDGTGRYILEESVRAMRECFPELCCVLFEIPRNESIYSGAGCMFGGKLRKLVLSWGAQVVPVGYLSFISGGLKDSFDLMSLPFPGIPGPDRVCLVRYLQERFRSAGMDPRYAEEVVYGRPYVRLMPGYGMVSDLR